MIKKYEQNIKLPCLLFSFYSIHSKRMRNNKLCWVMFNFDNFHIIQRRIFISDNKTIPTELPVEKR